MNKRIYFKNFKKVNFIYPKNCLPLWIKNFLYKKNQGVLSEILTGTSFNLTNTVLRKFNIFEIQGNTEQTAIPNPDYPQPIYNVTGNVKNKIENKNLFDVGSQKTDYSKEDVINGFDSSEVKINVLASGSTYSYRLQNFIGNKTYTFTAKPSAGYSRVYVRLRNLDDTGWLSSSDVTINGMDYVAGYQGWYSTFTGTDIQKTINIPECKYCQFGIGYSSQTSIVGTVQTISNIQLEYSSTATSYEEHQEQNLPLTLGDIELCKIDEAKDYFYKNNGKWYLHKEIGKAIFDGSNDETWRSENFGTFYRYSIDIPNAKIYNASEDFVGYSNYFYKSIKVLSASTIDLGQFIHYRDSKSFYFASDKKGLNIFRPWLSTHNTEVYYVLETPTDTEITDETLISQLEAIKELYTYKGTTNIEGTSSEISPILKIQYYEKEQ